MKLINIGFGSLIAAERLISVLSPDSAPIKRMIQDSRERGLLVDASYGRKTKSVLVTDGGYLFLSALTPETVKAYDLVIITTAHTKVDYQMVAECGVPVFDCKNVTKHIQNRENIEVL